MGGFSIRGKGLQEPAKSIPEELSYKHLIQALEMHMDMSQGYVSEFTREFTIKMPQSRWSTLTAADIVRACAIDMHMDISEGTVSARIYNKNAADHDGDNRAARACAVEMHMDTSGGTGYARTST